VREEPGKRRKEFFGGSEGKKRQKKTRLSLSSLLLFLSLSPLTVSKKTSTGEAKIVPIFAKNVCRAVFVRGGGVLLFFSR
jgi:hypothetical protein